MAIPSHYSLIKEHPHSYELHDSRDDRKFHVAKQGLNLGMHGNLSKIKAYAEGGAVKKNEFEDMVDTLNPVNALKGDEATQQADYVAAASALPRTAGELAMNDPGAMLPAPTPPGAAPPPQVEAPQPQPAEAQPETPAVAAPAPAAPVDPFSTHASGINSALGGQRAAVLGAQKIEDEASAQTANAYKEYAAKIADMETPQQVQARYADSNKKLFDAAANKNVDPDRWWHNQSVPSKIGAALGMIFSGLGAASAGQSNFAMDNIQKSIDRDIDAQKLDQNKTMNLWRMNRDNMQSDMEANLATQNQLLTGVKAKAAQYAAMTGSAEAKLRLAPLLMEIDQKMQTNDLRRALLSGPSAGGGQPGIYNSDPAQLVPLLVQNPEQANKIQAEIQAAQNTNRMGQSILKNFEDAVKENTAIKTGAGFLRTPGSVYALHQAMQPTFADLEGTVRQAAMDNTFKNITPAPGDSEHTIQQKRQAVTEYLQSKASAPIAKGAGIDLQRFASTRSVLHAPGPTTKTVNGVTYTRGPNGEAVPVR